MDGSAKRIFTVATALHAGFTVEEMNNLDLGYVPPVLTCLGPGGDSCQGTGQETLAGWD